MEIRLDEAGQATVLQNGFEITPSQLLQATEILRKFAVQWTESERKSSAPE